MGVHVAESHKDRSAFKHGKKTKKNINGVKPLSCFVSLSACFIHFSLCV